jgi:aspartate aminotransferase-like enzyme
VNLLGWPQVQKRYGTEIRVVMETPSGGLNLEYLNDVLRSRPPGSFTVVSISHIPTSSGRVYDAQAVGTLLKRYPGMILPDAP